jgi:hypothetical protein
MKGGVATLFNPKRAFTIEVFGYIIVAAGMVALAVVAFSIGSAP